MNALAERFRREGLADAVVLLVAKRVHPTTTAEEWGRHLGLEQHEVRAAIGRLRERHGLTVEPIKRASTHGNAGRKWGTLEERRERNDKIRTLRQLGWSMPDIGAEVGLTSSMVSKILGKMAG